MAHVGVSEGLVQLLGAASNLGDAELAVALQGILSRRPAVREALLNVMQAESIVEQRSSPSAVKATPSQSTQSSRPADPIVRLRIGSQRLAEFHGADSVGTEHVLAAAVHMLKETSRLVLGDCLHSCLVELLERSNLQPPLPGQSQQTRSSDVLPIQADAGRIFTSMANSAHDASTAVFHALIALPDNSAASQLLEMAKIFAQSRETPTQKVEAASAEPGSLTDYAQVSEGAGDVASDLMVLAQRFAKQNQSRSAGTEHVLAAALQNFPEESEKLFGKALREQLQELLEKSSLVPPESTVGVDGVTFEPEATKLFEDWRQRGPSSDNMIQMLLSLPDDDSATQLIEMAKVFTERS